MAVVVLVLMLDGQIVVTSKALSIPSARKAHAYVFGVARCPFLDSSQHWCFVQIPAIIGNDDTYHRLMCLKIEPDYLSFYHKGMKCRTDDGRAPPGRGVL